MPDVQKETAQYMSTARTLLLRAATRLDELGREEARRHVFAAVVAIDEAFVSQVLEQVEAEGVG
jgi:hypothetical protein